MKIILSKNNKLLLIVLVICCLCISIVVYLKWSTIETTYKQYIVVYVENDYIKNKFIRKIIELPVYVEKTIVNGKVTSTKIAYQGHYQQVLSIKKLDKNTFIYNVSKVKQQKYGFVYDDVSLEEFSIMYNYLHSKYKLFYYKATPEFIECIFGNNNEFYRLVFIDDKMLYAKLKQL